MARTTFWLLQRYLLKLACTVMAGLVPAIRAARSTIGLSRWGISALD